MEPVGMKAQGRAGKYFRWAQIPASENAFYFGFMSSRYEPDACKEEDLFNQQEIEDHKNKFAQFMAEEKLEEANQVRAELLQKVPNNVAIVEYFYQIDLKRTNVLAAEGMISRLLYLSPDNSAYKSARDELLPKVDLIDNELFAQIDHLKQQYMVKLPEINLNLVAIRKASFLERFWQNTLAIEGGSLTLAQITEFAKKTEAERKMDVSKKTDPEQLDYCELKGAMLLSEYVEQKGYNSPADLRKLDRKELLEMHTKQMELYCKLLCEINMVEDVITGKFRCDDDEDVLGRIPYQPVFSDDVEREMEKFVHFLRSSIERVEQGQMHAVGLAALAHFFFVHIHPFGDGNGRMSRKILNIILQCFSFPPIIVQNRKKREYMDAIAAANVGDLRQFVRLIAQYVAESLRVSVQQGGIPYPELDGE